MAWEEVLNKVSKAMLMVAPPLVTAWITDQLPKRGLSASENERRVKAIVLSIIATAGINWIAEKILGYKGTTLAFGKRIAIPGYYGD